MSLKGKLPIFINSFLTECFFNVRVGSSLSNLYDQEMSVPQVIVLSVTHFNIKIIDIVKCMNPGIGCLLYVDDFLIYYKSKKYTINRKK